MGSSRSGLWFIFGLAWIGVLTGYLLDMSRSPVVGIALPLIFGLAGGVGGLYITRAELGTEQGRQRLTLLGQSLGAFALGLVVSSILTFELLASMDRTVELTSLAGVTQLPTSELVRLAELRTRLRILGASSGEQEKVLELAVKSAIDQRKASVSLQQDQQDAVAHKLREVLPEISRTLEILDNTQASLATDERADQLKSKFSELQVALMMSQPLLTRWIKDADQHKPLNLNTVREQFSIITSALDGVTTDNNNKVSLYVLAPYPQVAKELAELRVIASMNEVPFGGLTSFTVDSGILDNKDDAFLKIILGAGPNIALGPGLPGLAEIVREPLGGG
jgi:hypothetical protein